MHHARESIARLWAPRTAGARPAAREGVTVVITQFERIVDRLPKARQLARSRYGCNVRTALRLLLPERSVEEREAILRGVVRHRIFDRAIFMTHTALPRLAGAIANMVPIDASCDLTSVFERDAPVIIASAHFGPLFFQLLVLRRLLFERRVIVVLRHEALYLRRVVPFLRRIGFEFIIDNEHSLRTLVRTIAARPRTVVMFAFDHTHEGRRLVPFLGANITTCNGLAFIADAGRAHIVMSLWKWADGRPRVTLTGPYGLDRTLPPVEARECILAQLYCLLEARIAEAPEQWGGWEYIVSRIVAPVTALTNASQIAASTGEAGLR